MSKDISKIVFEPGNGQILTVRAGTDSAPFGLKDWKIPCPYTAAVRGFSPMKTKTKIQKCITMSDDLAKEVGRRAGVERRSFSGMVETILAKWAARKGGAK